MYVSSIWKGSPCGLSRCLLVLSACPCLSILLPCSLPSSISVCFPPFTPLFQNLRNQQAAYRSKQRLGLQYSIQGPDEAVTEVPGRGTAETTTSQPPAVRKHQGIGDKLGGWPTLIPLPVFVENQYRLVRGWAIGE